MYVLGRMVGIDIKKGNKNALIDIKRYYGARATRDWFHLPWKRQPFYGHETLEEVGATPKKYADVIIRERGILI